MLYEESATVKHVSTKYTSSIFLAFLFLFPFSRNPNTESINVFYCRLTMMLIPLESWLDFLVISWFLLPCYYFLCPVLLQQRWSVPAFLWIVYFYELSFSNYLLQGAECLFREPVDCSTSVFSKGVWYKSPFLYYCSLEKKTLIGPTCQVKSILFGGDYIFCKLELQVNFSNLWDYNYFDWFKEFNDDLSNP